MSPDLAQAIIETIVKDIDTYTYMGNCMLFTDKDFEYHIDLIDKLLTVLVEDGMKCNPLKCAWAVQETSFLENWMILTAVKSMKKKIDVVCYIPSKDNILADCFS